MPRTVFALATTVIVSVLVGCANAANAGGLRLLSENDAGAAERRLAATKWIQAVVAADREAIVGLVVPEYRESVASELQDPESELSRQLFVGSESVRVKFEGRDVRVALLAHIELEAVGGGTSACYYTGAEPSWPKTDDDMAALERASGAMCFFMFRSEGSWYFSVPEPPGEGGDV
jgi:hypothetical protein